MMLFYLGSTNIDECRRQFGGYGKMTINYSYRITYLNGKQSDSRNRHISAVCDINREAYLKMAKYVVSGGELNSEDIEDIDIKQAVSCMKDRVTENDIYYSMDGRLLQKALKKPREIENVEVWLDDYDLARFRRMRDIDAVFARPEQQIVLTRYDGSTVALTVKDGMVEIYDSNKRGCFIRTEEDRIANEISR